MTVNSETGVIHWVPELEGNVTVKITATNPAGSDMRTLEISVSDPPPPPDFSSAVNNRELLFATDPEAPWFVQGAITHGDGEALRSADIDDDEISSVQTTVIGPGTLSFWWAVSSEEDYDYLVLRLDGARQRRISGTPLAWASYSLEIPAGVHTVAWVYEKDLSLSEGADAGFVDEISWVPDDTDGDGLADGWEVENFGSLDQSGDDDPDRDGESNAEEQAARTDPNDSQSRLQIRAVLVQPDGTVDLLFTSVAGRRYVVEGGDTLQGFAPLGAPVLAGGTITAVTGLQPGDGSPGPDAFYFRIVVVD
jgi:hypothetical protein